MIQRFLKNQLKLIQFVIVKQEKVAIARLKYNLNQLANALGNQNANVKLIQLALAKLVQTVIAELKFNQNQKLTANARLDQIVHANQRLNVDANVDHAQKENVKVVAIFPRN